MRQLAACVLAMVLVALAGAPDVRAQTTPQVTVDVLETWPAGPRVELAGNRNYYLRLAYRSEAPVRIWARPYYRGREVATGSHPSGLHDGEGETFGWFFLHEPGLRVDEVRIRAGDGTARGTREVARHRVEVVAVAGSSAAVEPRWVVEHRQLAEARQRAERERAAAEPVEAGDVFLVGGFMLAVPVLGLLGIVAPAWALYRWRGGWRLAAALPLLALGLVLLNIVVGVALDPTSHNLWPFEILMVAVPGLVWIGVLALLRRCKVAWDARSH